jgi:hypothetical protein
MMNSTGYNTEYDAVTDMIAMAYICTAFTTAVIMCCTCRPKDPWKQIGTFDGNPLYERTYPSGKKSWRFKEEGEYVYPHRRDLIRYAKVT